MAEEIQTPPVQEPVNPAPAANPFSEESWQTAPTIQEPVVTEPAVTPTTQEPAATTTEPAATEPAPVVDVWKEAGFESAEDAKQKLEELKTLKEKTATPTEITFANEESKKFFELFKEGKEDDLFNFLSEKKKLERLTTGEVTNQNAADIVKLSMHTKSSGLSADEIDFLFDEKFSTPAKPEQSLSESDEDYDARVAQWESRVKELEKKVIIEAKMAVPELQKLKAHLVIPEIPKPEPAQQQPSQESLEAVKKAREGYVAQLETAYKNFKGFDATVKNELVEVPVSFVVPDEEKVALKKQVEDFDALGYLNNRWFDENNSAKVEKIMADLYLLEKTEKVIQGISNKAASEAIAEYIKKTANVSVAGPANGTFNPQNVKDQAQQMGEFFFSQT